LDDPQIIRTPSGDADDVAIYKARKAELAGDPEALLPEPVSADMLKGLSRFKALRRWRGLTQSALAEGGGRTRLSLGH
jgi:hypothetical protein